jgi:hypothetical protein
MASLGAIVVQPHQLADMGTKVTKVSTAEAYGVAEVHAEANSLCSQLFCASNLV